MLHIYQAIRRFSRVSLFIFSSYIYATSVTVSPDTAITGTIVITDLISSTLFTSQGLEITSPPSPGKSLGFVSQSSTSLSGSDQFMLADITGKKLTLTVTTPSLAMATISCPIVVSSFNEELNFQVPTSSVLTLTGAISGSGSFRKTGSGTLNLNSLSELRGQLLVDEGSVVATSVISNLNAAVQIAAGSSLNLSVGSFSAPFLYNDGCLFLSNEHPTSISANIQGQGSLTKTGLGSLTLTGSNSYSGGTTVSSGRLILTSGALQGAIVNNSELEWQLSQGIVHNSSISGSGSFYKTGPEVLTLNSNFSQATGNLFVQEGTLSLSDLAFVQNNIDVNDSASLILNTNLDHIYNGIITGTGNISKNGVGALTLAGPASYSKLDISKGNVILNVKSLSGNVVNNANLTLNIGVDTVYNGNLSSTGLLTKRGGSKLIFKNPISQKGTTAVQEGSIELHDGFFIDQILNNGSVIFDLSQSNDYYASISGTGSVVTTGLGGVTFYGPQSYTGDTTVGVGSLTLYDDAFLQNYNVTGALNLVMERHDAAYNAVISGPGSVYKRGVYSWIINTPQAYTGITSIQEGSLYINVDNALSNQSEVNLNSFVTMFLQGHRLSIGGLTGSGQISLENGVLSIGTNNRSASFDGCIYGTGSVIKSGNSSWTVRQSQTYLGLTTVSQGSLVQGLSQIVPLTNTITLESLGLLDLNNFNLTLAGLTGTGTVALSGANLTLNLTTPNSFGGVISSSGSVYKTGNGSLTLRGQNTYLGETFLQNGSLVVESRQALPKTTSLVMSPGTTLSLKGTDQTIQSLKGAGTLNLENNSWYVSNHDETIFRGAITGTNSSLLAFQNQSEAILSGTLSTTGVILVDTTSSLVLQSTLPGGSIINNGLLTIDTTANILNITIPISGIGSLVKSGAHDLQINKELTYVGTTTINEGKLILNNINLSNRSLLNNGQLYLNGTSNEDQWNIEYPISGTGSVVYNPLAGQKIVMRGDLSYLGSTRLTAGTLTHDHIHLILNEGSHNIAQGARYESINSTIDLLGSISLTNGLWHMSATEINTAVSGNGPVLCSSQGNILYQTGIWIDDLGLTTNASSRDLYLNCNIYGTGGFTKTGSHRVRLSPPNEVSYTGLTVISQGGLVLNENFNSISDIKIAREGSLYFHPTGSSIKHILSDINGPGSLIVETGSIQLEGSVTYGGPTTINNTASLSVGSSFSTLGTISIDGDFNITIPNGGNHRLDNTFQGNGTVNKYGEGLFILGGDFSNLQGVLQIWNGTLWTTSFPSRDLNIIGDYSVVSSRNSVLTLTSHSDPATLRGSIIDFADTRVRLVGNKDDGELTVRNFILSGVLDIFQRKRSTSDAVASGYQFKLENLVFHSGCKINFQFDQSDKTGILRPFLNFNASELSSNITCSLQAINQSNLFTNQKYRLIELSNPSEDEIAKVRLMASTITAPITFAVIPTVTFDEDTQILTFDVAITKNVIGAVIQKSRVPRSPTLVKLANQLQSLGTSTAPLAQNACNTLEFSKSDLEMTDNLNKLKPTGNKKPAQSITATNSSSSAQTANSSFNLQALALNLHKNQSGRYKSPFSGFGHKTYQNSASVLNTIYQNQIQQDGEEHDFNWAHFLNGLELSGLSLSVESNYVHQNIKSQDTDPDLFINAWGTTLGASRVLQEKYIVGILASYLGRRIELDPNSQNKTSKTHERVRSLGLFTTYQDPNQPYYVSGFLSLGNHHYNSERTWLQPYFNSASVSIDDLPAQANSSHKGYDITGNLELGWTHIINQSMAIQPFVGAGFISLYEPEYVETSINPETGESTLYGNKMPLSHVKKQSRSIGVQGIHSVVMDDASYQFSSRMSYETAKLQGNQSIFEYAYLYDESSIIQLVTDNQRFGAFEMSLGLNAAYSNQWIISTNYVGHFGSSLISHTVVGSVQYTFS